MNEIKSGKQYAITLVSPGNSLSWDTAGLSAATALAGIGTVAGTFYIPIFKGEVAAVGSTGTYALYKLTQKSGTTNLNYIYLSDYDSIKYKCAKEAGVDE